MMLPTAPRLPPTARTALPTHLPVWAYDAAGNATGDGAYSNAWDAESYMKTAASVTYAYDAQGRRVSKSTGKNYIYGLGADVHGVKSELNFSSNPMANPA